MTPVRITPDGESMLLTAEEGGFATTTRLSVTEARALAQRITDWADPPAPEPEPELSPLVDGSFGRALSAAGVSVTAAMEHDLLDRLPSDWVADGEAAALADWEGEGR